MKHSVLGTLTRTELIGNILRKKTGRKEEDRKGRKGQRKEGRKETKKGGREGRRNEK
jgi:hypothetical protein